MDDSFEELNEILARYMDRPFTKQLVRNYIMELTVWAEKYGIDIWT
jgi:hypothetical protein